MSGTTFSHVAVSGRGATSRVIEDTTCTFPGLSPIADTAVARSGAPSDVATAASRAPEMGRRLMDGGAAPYRVTRMLTSVRDAATRRLIELAVEKLGPGPARFAFLAVGKHGREELTFSGDQESALVYGNDAGEGAGEYFVELGRLVTDWLLACGYPLGMGSAMAKNPRWCQPLSVWRLLHDWIREAAGGAGGRGFAHSSDFRWSSASGAGHALRSHVHEETRRHPAFLRYWRPTPRLFAPPAHLPGDGTAG